jgi:hypothetical protein
MPAHALGTHAVVYADFTPKNPLEDLAKAAVQTGVSYMHKVGEMISASSKFDPSMDWFLNQYSRAFAIALFFMAATLLWTVAKSVRAGADGSDAFAAAFGRLPLAFLLATFFPGMALLMSNLADGLTGVVTLGQEDNAKLFLNNALKFANDMSPNDVTGGVGTMLVVGFVMTVAGVFLFAELVLRTAGLYLGALFAPFMFAALINRQLWAGIRRPITIWIGLLFAKPIIAMCLAAMWAAGAGVNTISDSQGHTVVSERASTMMFMVVAALLASVALPVLWHFIPMLGDTMADSAMSRRNMMSSVPRRSVTRPTQTMSNIIDTRMSRSMDRAKNAGPGALKQLPIAQKGPAASAASSVSLSKDANRSGWKTPAPSAQRTPLGAPPTRLTERRPDYRSRASRERSSE